MCLDLPTIGLVAALQIGLGLLIITEHPLEPVEAGLAEQAPVGVEQGPAVADVKVALPRGRVGGEVVEITFTLHVVVERVSSSFFFLLFNTSEDALSSSRKDARVRITIKGR
jgi:hypothetical protein